MSKSFLRYTLIFPFLGILVFTLSLIFAPITYNFNLESFLVIYSFYIFYIFGWLLFHFSSNKVFNLKSTRFNINFSKSYFHELLLLRKIFLYLTIVFLMLNFYDFFILGDVLSKGIVALREERTLEGQRGSFVGFFIVLLSATPLLLMTLTYLLANEKK
jgi:hypothetical protein